MARVTFLPFDKSFESKPGQSVLDVALENGIGMQHACGGFCACATCQIHVTSGAEILSSSTEEERERLEDSAEQVTPHSRLACQSILPKTGEVVVTVINLE